MRRADHLRSKRTHAKEAGYLVSRTVVPSIVVPWAGSSRSGSCRLLIRVEKTNQEDERFLWRTAAAETAPSAACASYPRPKCSHPLARLDHRVSPPRSSTHFLFARNRESVLDRKTRSPKVTKLPLDATQIDRSLSTIWRWSSVCCSPEYREESNADGK
jgi:hypothetical protein